MNVKNMRLKSGLNQQEFWGIVGVTQSGGSRYETGGAIPKPTQMLLIIAYGPERKAAALATKLRRAA